jgi:hypothetical protein
MDRAFIPILTLALGVAGCAETTPNVSTAGEQQAMGSPATDSPVSVATVERPRETLLGRYDVPTMSPHGGIVISSFGVNDLQVGDQQQPIRFLQLRMKVTNKDDTTPWTVDVRQQLLSLPNEGQSQPAFINGDQRNLPNLTVPVGQTRTIDLYYALPQTLQAATQVVPASELLSQVQAAGQTIAQRTSIGEQKPGSQVASANPQESEPYAAGQPLAPPTYDEYAEYPNRYPYDVGDYGWGLGFGWGPVWWFNPFFPSVAFVHPVFFNHQRFFVHHPFIGARAIHAVNVHRAFVGPHGRTFVGRSVTLHRANAFHGTSHAVVGRSFAGGFHGTGFHVSGMRGSAIHGGGFHGGGFHGGGFHGGGFHGGGFHGGGFHGGGSGGGGGFHGGGGGGHGGGGGGHR